MTTNTTWIEPPPREKGMGCFGRGCLIFIIFILLLVIAFCIGTYVGTSSKPRDLTMATLPPAESADVLTRFEQFKELSTTPRVNDIRTTPGEGATPVPSLNRIELSAAEINQLIAANRKVRGKASVSIDNNVIHIQVSIPLNKAGFRGRFLNGECDVPAPAGGDPRNLQFTQISLGGMPNAVLNALLGKRSIGSYLEEVVNRYNVRTLDIRDNKVIIETSSPIRR